MKKLFTLFLLGCAAATANAQYQVQNGGFEEWESVSYQPSFGDAKTGEEPLHWNSFLTGTGDLKSMAGANQLEKMEETRPGSEGKYSAKLFARDVLFGIYAQGNLTTGCISMNSMDATDANGNYNYTNTKDDNFNQKFTGMPDAMHVWVKFNCTNKNPYGKVNTILHTNGYYQDPYGNESNITAKVVAKAEKLDITHDTDWQELTIPFVYEEGVEERPAYALVSFASNAQPGSGSAGDYMMVDDLEYLYYSELSTLTYDDVDIFQAGTTNYDLSNKVYNESKLACTSNGKGATIEKYYNKETGELTITVKGDNWSEDNTNQHVYTIQFKTAVTTNYTNDLTVSVNGDTSAPQETTIQLIEQVDGTYSFALKNFCLGETMAVGNIQLDNLTLENGKISTSQGIQITAGDDPNITNWMGPTLTALSGGSIPVDLEATVDEVRNMMTAKIAIDMTSTALKQMIDVTFAPSLTANSETSIADGLSGLYNVTLSRTFAAGWNTVCLPFATTVAALGAEQVQAFTAFADNTLTFTKVADGNLAANTPYLIYFEEAKDLSAAPIYMPVEIESSTPGVVNHGDVTFTGNYTAGMSMVGLYGVAEQNGAQYIMKGSAGSTLGSTGAYFTVSGTTAGVNTLSLDIEGEGTTGIESIVAEEGQAFDVYTLTGVKVRTAATDLDGLQRGIYIVNGKKVLVK